VTPAAHSFVVAHPCTYPAITIALQFKQVSVPVNEPATLILNLSATEFEVAGSAATALEKFADLCE
jgi:hypothetical protein